MAGQSRKSRKQSAANSSYGQPELRLFLDRSLGRHAVADRLRAAGVEVEIHDDHFTQSELDHVWLAEVGRRGWVVLTKDQRIRYRQNEMAAAQEANVRMFVLTAGQVTGEEVGSAFVKALPAIFRLVKRQQPPFVARVTADGEVRLYQREK
jgi:predicted nuclease of predicted toxin-antitoxin system